jgi:hypothetical protein
MKRQFVAFVAATAAVLTGSIGAAQNRAVVPVNIKPAAAVDVVLFSGASAGRTVAVTDRTGKGTFDIAEFANIGKLEVVEEKCPKATRVLLVAEGASAPNSPKCRKRRLGAFVVGSDGALNVALSSGMSTVVKAAIAAGAGAGALIATGMLKGDELDQPIDDSGLFGNLDNRPPPPPPPAPPAQNTFGGIFNIAATKSVDTGCNFSPSFTGQAAVQTNGSTVTVTIKERQNRTYTGTIQSNGTFSASGNGSWGYHAYQGQIQGQINGNSISGTESMNFTMGCPDRQVAYRFTGNR